MRVNRVRSAAVIFSLAILLIGLTPPAAHADTTVWAMEGGGTGNLYRINATTNTTTLVGAIKDPVLGDVGPGWATVADTPGGILYFLRRFESDVHVFSLDSNNIMVSSGVITNVMDAGSRSAPTLA